MCYNSFNLYTCERASARMYFLLYILIYVRVYVHKAHRIP